MISATRQTVGRKQINHEQTPLRLPEGTLARVDAVLAEGEKRADLFRAAVEAELRRRERSGTRSGTPSETPSGT